MKKILFVLALLASTSTTSFAGDAPGKGNPPDQGQEDGVDRTHRDGSHVHAYACHMGGEIKGFKIGFVFGAQYLGGRGMITCIDKQRRTFNMPVKIRFLGAGLGFDLTYVRQAQLISGGIGHVRSPMDLTGSFSVGKSAGVTLIKRGFNIQSAISVKKHGHGLAFELGFQGEKAYGLGARIHGTVMTIKPISHDDYAAMYDLE